MKFRRILAAMTAALASVAFLASCEGDGDDADLEGSWELNSISEEVIINGKSVESDSWSYPLEENPTYGEWLVVSGNTLTAVVRDSEEGETVVYHDSWPYTVKGNKLSWTDEDGDVESFVFKVSGDKLTLTIEDDKDEDEFAYYAEEYGIKNITSVKYTMKMTLTKVADSAVPRATAVVDRAE